MLFISVVLRKTAMAFWGADERMFGKNACSNEVSLSKTKYIKQVCNATALSFPWCCNKPVFWGACCTSKFTLLDFLDQ